MKDRITGFMLGAALVFVFIVLFLGSEPSLKLNDASGIEVNATGNLDFLAVLDVGYKVAPGQTPHLTYKADNLDLVVMDNVPVAKAFPVYDAPYTVTLRIQLYNTIDGSVVWSEPLSVVVPGFGEALQIWKVHHPGNEALPKRRES